MDQLDRRPQAAVAALRDAVGLIGQLEPNDVEPGDVASLLVELCRTVDQFGGEAARFARSVSDSELWLDSGASSMAAWLSAQTGMGFGRARHAAELGEAMAEVPALDAAVRAGELSPAAAATVVPAVGDDGSPMSRGG